MASQYLTVGEAAATFSTDQWRIRRIVDSLNVDIPRAGSYRLIPRSALGLIAIELQRRGWLPEVAKADLPPLQPQTAAV